MNVLDPDLLAPHRQRGLAESARQQRREQRQAMEQFRAGGAAARGSGGRQGGVGGGGDDDELSAQEMAFVQGLDPSAPLLQLFWQSALPWNQVEGAMAGGDDRVPVPNAPPPPRPPLAAAAVAPDPADGVAARAGGTGDGTEHVDLQRETR
mmetsp:Transcript_27502/g.55358  ORF Transcript_27502/g.55358 Transcript_27502/m.55358 type:complete len:151 (-) Transcript_27502:53-505(-)